MTLAFDVVCLSHLGWDFVYQRPQHLMSRWAREHRVFFVHEMRIDDSGPRLEVRHPEENLWVVDPHVPDGLPDGGASALLQELLRDLLAEHGVRDYLLWFFTPQAALATRELCPLLTVYDCMDELSAFRGASPVLLAREADLLARADLVFTGGWSLYEAKRRRHPCVYPFPSSVDAEHFRQARTPLAEPADQARLARPRIGYYGVIDERLDYDLIAAAADARPAWQLVLLGPVAKVEPGELPRRDNLHYSDRKPYADLPRYLAGWDVAIMPFARNEATRFISPTKTLEYLAAGKPVVSTPVPDVARGYGSAGLVRLAADPAAFVAAIEAALAEDPRERRPRIDALLAETSWDRTWEQMAHLIERALAERTSREVAGIAGR